MTNIFSAASKQKRKSVCIQSSWNENICLRWTTIDDSFVWLNGWTHKNKIFWQRQSIKFEISSVVWHTFQFFIDKKNNSTKNLNVKCQHRCDFMGNPYWPKFCCRVSNLREKKIHEIYLTGKELVLRMFCFQWFRVILSLEYSNNSFSWNDAEKGNMEPYFCCIHIFEEWVWFLTSPIFRASHFFLEEKQLFFRVVFIHVTFVVMMNFSSMLSCWLVGAEIN